MTPEKPLDGNCAHQLLFDQLVDEINSRPTFSELQAEADRKFAETLKNVRSRATQAQAAIAARQAHLDQIRQDSNTQNLTDPTPLADLLSKAAGSPYPTKGDTIIRDDVNHELRQAHPPGPGWGKWGHLTRAQMSDRMKQWIYDTGGAGLPYTLEGIWRSILADSPEEPTI
jgi:hypothetical protein